MSPTLARLHCTCVYMLVGLFGPATYPKFQMRTFQHFTMIECPCQCALQLISRENESEGVLSDCSVAVKENMNECVECEVHTCVAIVVWLDE